MQYSESRYFQLNRGQFPPPSVEWEASLVKRRETHISTCVGEDLCGILALSEPSCRGGFNWRLIFEEAVKLIPQNNY